LSQDVGPRHRAGRLVAPRARKDMGNHVAFRGRSQQRARPDVPRVSWGWSVSSLRHSYSLPMSEGPIFLGCKETQPVCLLWSPSLGRHNVCYFSKKDRGTRSQGLGPFSGGLPESSLGLDSASPTLGNWEETSGEPACMWTPWSGKRFFFFF
jgi:hypothetical protein